jgi:hypothetical protein
MGWSDVAYHKIVGLKGKVSAGRTEAVSSGGTLSSSKNSVEVCLCGDFDAQTPTPEAVSALKEILVNWCKTYNLVPSEKTIVGHKDVQAKKGDADNRCPGKNLHGMLGELRAYVAGELAKYAVAQAAKTRPGLRL